MIRKPPLASVIRLVHDKDEAMNIDQKAIELWDGDHGLRAIALSASTEAIGSAKHRISEGDITWKDVHDVVMEAIARTLINAFDGEDAELAARMERDRRRMQNEGMLRT